MSKQAIVLSTALAGVVVFIVAFMSIDNQPIKQEAPEIPKGSALIRFHSPILGPSDAPVTSSMRGMSRISSHSQTNHVRSFRQSTCGYALRGIS